MNVRGITKADFDFLVQVLDRWWGGPSGLPAHPLFFYEFGEYALVAEAHGEVVGFLLGFMTKDTGYIHLVGIHPDHRREGVGNRLYQTFTDRCRAEGKQRVKAIAAVGHEAPIRFHEALGFSSVEEHDYAGPGRARMVFVKEL